MTTNQAMRDDIYEGILYIHLKASEAMDAGDVVSLHATSAGYVSKATSATVPFGYSAQQVTASGVTQYALNGLISHTAAVGDYIGVYVCGGIYNTKDATSCTFGKELYVSSAAAGKVTTAVPAGGTSAKVGICVVAKDTSTGIGKIKSYL